MIWMTSALRLWHVERTQFLTWSLSLVSDLTYTYLVSLRINSRYDSASSLRLFCLFLLFLEPSYWLISRVWIFTFWFIQTSCKVRSKLFSRKKNTDNIPFSLCRFLHSFFLEMLEWWNVFVLHKNIIFTLLFFFFFFFFPTKEKHKRRLFISFLKQEKQNWNVKWGNKEITCGERW